MKKILIISCFLISLQSFAQDWANLQRYKAENEQLLTQKVPKNRIVFMGNSITEGWSNFQPTFFDNYTRINRGISGQTTPQMVLRFRQDVLQLQPKIVVILAGTNDIAQNTGPITLDEIAGNIFTMCELAKQNHIQVIICSVLPALDYPWRKGLEPAQKIIELNKKLKKYASENNIAYVDYFSAMVDDRNGLLAKYTYDGVHPNKGGYEVMENLINKQLKKRIK